MKKSYLLIILACLIGIVSINIFMDNTSENELMTKQESNDEKINEELSYLIEYNRDISNKILYISESLGSRSEAEIFNDAKGICSDYVYVFIKELVRRGNNWRAVSINSSYQQAIHVVVEVYIGDSWITFDPTFGEYYMYSVEELKMLEDFQRYNPENAQSAFLSYNTLNNLLFLSYFYSDTFFEVPKEFDCKITDTNFISYEGYDLDKVFDNNSYTYFSQYDDLQIDNYFVIDFSEPQSFYKITYNFISDNLHPIDFSILGFVDNNWVVLTEESNWENPTEGHFYTLRLEENVQCEKVKFIFSKAATENRIVISEIDFYE